MREMKEEPRTGWRGKIEVKDREEQRERKEKKKIEEGAFLEKTEEKEGLGRPTRKKEKKKKSWAT
jgi:hypothetical protein